MSVTEERQRAVAALAASWQVPVDDEQVSTLLSYCDLLLSWGARINLTAAPSVEALIESHLPDAFALAARLRAPAAVIDIGSGGGLPAIPLAILRPALVLELCEPIAKKGAFLRTAIRELGLVPRVRVTGGRGEQIAATRPGAFDVAISRATLPPPAWVALGRKLVRSGGRVFALVAADALATEPDRELYLGGRRAIVEIVSRETEPRPVIG
jgi:16S rRNA (guanine527-N7)-methyltransferase